MSILGFFRPNSIEEAKVLLFKNKNSKLLAGGTDLVPELSSEKECPEYLIDLGGIEELKLIEESEEYVSIGSMVTFTEIRENESIINNFGALIECAKYMGSPQIRNVATLGGNIANAGSAADAVPCIIGLDGTLVIECNLGNGDLLRKVSCEDYFRNYTKEKLNENEILTKIILPKAGRVSAYYKLGKRNALAIARVSAVVNLKFENDIVTEFTLCLGAVGRYPFRATQVEVLALGKNIEFLYSDEVLNLIEAAVCESIKGRKTLPFKKEAIKGAYKEALRLALEKKW